MTLARVFGTRRSRPRPEPRNFARELIARHAPGRSFIDVGCIWKVHGAYAFHALDHGATRIAGLDVTPATPEFTSTNASRGNAIHFVQGDINDPAIAGRLGRFDVVFCAGVLYHAPNPLFTLEQLLSICGETLILVTATVPEQPIAQTAIFLPLLDDAARQRLGYTTPHVKRGVDTPFAPEKGYGNWFWGFAPSCVRAMLGIAGFDIVESHEAARAVFAVCRPRGSAVS